MKRLERDNGKMRKQTELVRKERDATKSDLSKANSMKHKLETLCRELQKENKRIKVRGHCHFFSRGDSVLVCKVLSLYLPSAPCLCRHRRRAKSSP